MSAQYLASEDVRHLAPARGVPPIVVHGPLCGRSVLELVPLAYVSREKDPDRPPDPRPVCRACLRVLAELMWLAGTS